MGMSVEPQTFLIRGGRQHTKFGDKYDYVITAVKNGEHSVRFIGMVRKDGAKKFGMGDVANIKKYFLSIGITHAEWERIDSDEVRNHGVRL